MDNSISKIFTKLLSQHPKKYQIFTQLMKNSSLYHVFNGKHAHIMLTLEIREKLPLLKDGGEGGGVTFTFHIFDFMEFLIILLIHSQNFTLGNTCHM